MNRRGFLKTCLGGAAAAFAAPLAATPASRHLLNNLCWSDAGGPVYVTLEPGWSVWGSHSPDMADAECVGIAGKSTTTYRVAAKFRYLQTRPMLEFDGLMKILMDPNQKVTPPQFMYADPEYVNHRIYKEMSEPNPLLMDLPWKEV